MFKGYFVYCDVTYTREQYLDLINTATSVKDLQDINEVLKDDRDAGEIDPGDYLDVKTEIMLAIALFKERDAEEYL